MKTLRLYTLVLQALMSAVKKCLVRWLGRRSLTRRWGILHWRGKRLNLAEETFIGLCDAASAILKTPLSTESVTQRSEAHSSSPARA